MFLERTYTMNFKKVLMHTFCGAFLQNKDNNVSIENQLENESLTEEIAQRMCQLEKNRDETLKLLNSFHLNTELKLSGLLLTKKEIFNRSKRTYSRLKQLDFIDENNFIKPGLAEVYLELAKG